MFSLFVKKLLTDKLTSNNISTKNKLEARFRFPYLYLLCYVIAGFVGLGLILHPIISNSLYDAKQGDILYPSLLQATEA